MIQVVVAFLGPLSTPLTRLLDLCQRMLGPAAREDAGVTTEVLAHVMERGAEEGALVGLEADLLVEVIELDRVRVREIMTPRVDALFLELSGEDRDRMIERALALGRSTLPVIDGGPDQVAGMVRMRDVFRYPDRPIRQLVMPVKFVPEVASALDLLRELRKDRTAEAVVVDEWGGTAGVVTAEDVFEEIVGDIRIEGEARVPAVVPLGEGRYRVAGALSIRDWNEAFGLDVVPTEFETVGGFVTALLGRIPRAGDEARAQNLLMKVHEVRGRRVLTVDIAVAIQAPESALEAVREP
jgi:CBS domain containing-hemolysin-like protein